MDELQALERMLKQLLEDMQVIQQQGAGYYSCASVARHYNKLLKQARRFFDSDDGLISMFEEIPETDPKDPGDKWKVLQAIRIDINQLITLLESKKEGTAS